MSINLTDFEFDIPSLRAATGVSYVEARILQLLMREEIATHEQLNELNGRARQLMYTMRLKLTRLGITIVNDREIGYSIPIKYKLRLKSLVEGDIAREIYRVRENNHTKLAG